MLIAAWPAWASTARARSRSSWAPRAAIWQSRASSSFSRVARAWPWMGSSRAFTATSPASRRSATSSAGSRAAFHGRFLSRRSSRRAAALAPGASGLVALDWMNGSRTPIIDSGLSGMILGLTLDSKPEDVYRALIEATAYGTRRIVDTHRAAGIRVDELVVCGGLTQDPLILQIYADVTGLPVHVASSNQAVALGAAIFGALAAGPGQGGFATMEEAISRMTASAAQTYAPEHRRASRGLRFALFGLLRRGRALWARRHASRHMKQLKATQSGEMQRPSK